MASAGRWAARCCLCLVLAFLASLAPSTSFSDRRGKLPTPAELHKSLPLPKRLHNFVNASRAAVTSVLSGEDDRLLVIIGPCSIHDPIAARDFAERLSNVAKLYEGQLFVVMRTFLEKPRTSVGWRGLVSDPDLSGSENLERGVALGRRVLLDVNAAGLPAAAEFLDPLVALYLKDLVAYGTIGARTVESPTHHALAASLPMPVGFKNTRAGDVESAVNAVIAASAPQRFLSVGPRGRLTVQEAAGNAGGHVVLRGGEGGPNYGNESVRQAASLLSRAGFEGRRVVVDCSHGNSGKQHEWQVDACRSVASQISEGEEAIGGVMVESFLEAGNQPLEPGSTKPAELRYGLSVTDACLDFSSAAALLKELSSAVVARRGRGVASWKEAVNACP